MNTFWENIGHSARIALTTNVYACAYTTHFLPQYYNTVLQMQSKGDQMSPRKKKNMSSLTNVPFSEKIWYVK